MPNRSLSLAYALAVVVSLFLAFFTVQAYSEFAVRGFDAQLRVDSLGTTASSAEVYGTIATFATSRDCTVAKVTFDLTDVSTRHLSVLGDGSADPGGRWLDHGVADFSRGVTTQVHPGAELGATSPVGSYGLSCGPAEAEALAAALREAGVTASADSYPTILSWHRYLAGTPIPAGYAIAAVAVVLLAGCGALLNARAYAVQRLQGAPFSSILRRDLAPIGRRLALHLGGAAVVCAIVLGAYNGFAQATTFLGLAAAVLAGLLLVTVTAHAVSTAAAQRIPLAAAIKGESVGAWVVPAAFGVRFCALVILVASIFSAVHAGQLIAGQQAARSAWQSAGGATSVGVGGDDQARAGEFAQRLGEVVVRALDDREAVLAARQPVSAFGTVTVVPEDQPVLLVSPSYLEEQNVRDAAGSRLVPAPGSCLTIHLPATLRADQQDDVVAAVGSWADYFGATCAVKRGAPLAEGSTLFDYGNAADPSASPLVDEPVVLVVDPASEVVSADGYGAYTSTGDVVFLDPAYVLEESRAAGIRDYVLSVTPIADAAAEEYQKLVRSFRLGLANIAAAAGVVLLTAVVVSSAYTRRYAQSVFVRYIAGWSFAARYRAAFLAEAASAVLLVAYVAANPPRTPPALGAVVAAAAPRLLGGAEPLVAVAVCLVSSALLVTALAVAQRRLLRTRSSDS
ncbi:hypothetical protein AB0O99_01650 [Cellulosimicrobium funkei]|uniref:hypothetical protein n=1 Tax=Cellulosimicrobium funkei TaxID=264251 RepID=UPI003413661F